MPFHVTCVCGWQTVIGDDHAGGALRCDRCGREVAIPRIAAPAPPPTPAATDTSQSPAIVPDVPLPAPRPRSRPAQARDLQRLAVSLGLLGVLSSLPVIFESWQAGDPTLSAAAPWAVAVVLVSLLEVIYAVYLYQLPVVTAARVVAYLTLAAAAAHAVVAGMAWWTTPDHPLMARLGLDRNLFSARQEALWCFLQSLLLGTVSYAAVRLTRRREPPT